MGITQADEERKGREAAFRVQRFWMRVRVSSTRRLMKRFTQVGPTHAYVKGIDFERLVTFLKERAVVHITQRCVLRLYYLSSSRHGLPSKLKDFNTKTFLGVFMIGYFPRRVFISMGPLEEDLFGCTRQLLACFESMWRFLRNGTPFAQVPHAVTKDFLPLLSEYLEQLESWQKRDHQNLVDKVKKVLLDLYKAQGHLAHGQLCEEDPVRMKVCQDIEHMRGKLLNLVGAHGVKAFDEERRAAATEAPLECGGQSLSGPLAHELLLDPTFQVSDSGAAPSPAECQVRNLFWKGVEAQLKQHYYGRLLKIFEEIRCELKQHAPQNLESQVDELLDLDLIKETVDDGSRAHELVSALVAFIRRIQRPSRDEQLNTAWEALCHANNEDKVHAFCRELRFVMDCIEYLKVDALNIRLQLLSGVVKEHGVEYERRRFYAEVEKRGTVTLDKTTRWICKEMQKLVAEKEGFYAQLEAKAASAYVLVHTSALFHLVVTDGFAGYALASEVCPETLRYDQSRLELWRMEFCEQTKALVLLVTVECNFPYPAKKKETLNTMLGWMTQGAARQDWCPTPEALVKVLVEEKGSVTEVEGQGITRVLFPCLHPSDSVYRLMGQRLRDVWWRVLNARNKEEEAALSLKGMWPQVLLPRVVKMIQSLDRLMEVNRLVHMSTYKRLIDELTLSSCAPKL